MYTYILLGVYLDLFYQTNNDWTCVKVNCQFTSLNARSLFDFCLSSGLKANAYANDEKDVGKKEQGEKKKYRKPFNRYEITKIKHKKRSPVWSPPASNQSVTWPIEIADG